MAVHDHSAQPKGLGALPAGAFTAAAAALTAGPFAGAGWFPAALAAGLGYLVVADRSPRRPARWMVLTTGAALFASCALLAQLRGRLDWAGGFVAAAVVLAYGAALLCADLPPVPYEATDSPASKAVGG